MYKTIYFRCLTNRNYSEALDYLYAGADFLLTNHQWESGAELARLVLEVYVKGKLDLTKTHLNHLCDLLRKMPPGDDRASFIQKAVDVLANHKGLLCGFNEQLARVLWSEGSLTEARFRIMLSYNGHAVGSFLIALHQRYGLRSEVDLFITQAVLQFLCMQQMSVAVLTFYTYTRGHPKLEPGPPFTRFPLLNFLWFLMLAIEKKCSVSVFDVLCDKYSFQLQRDSTYLSYLQRIGQLYFGVKLPDKDSNLLSNIMKLFNRLDDNLASSSCAGEEQSSEHGGGGANVMETMCVEDVD